MQLIHTPTLPPGCCFICRGSVRDSYIDTGVSHDYEGAYYICNMCLGEMAQMHAYLSFDEYKDLRVANEELQAQNYELIKRVGELEEIDSALARAGYKRTSDGHVVAVGGWTPPADANAGEQLLSSEDQLGAGEGETIESLHDEGLGELHSAKQSTEGFSLDL